MILPHSSLRVFSSPIVPQTEPNIGAIYLYQKNNKSGAAPPPWTALNNFNPPGPLHPPSLRVFTHDPLGNTEVPPPGLTPCACKPQASPGAV